MPGSIARSRAWPTNNALALCLVLLGGPVLAGDGSGTNNPYLLRGTYGLSPGNPGPSPTVLPADALTAPMPGNCAALIAAGIYSPDCVDLIVDAAPAAAKPVQPAVKAVVPEATRPPEMVAGPRAPAPVPLNSAPPIRTVPEAPPVDARTTGSIYGPETPGDDALTSDWQVVLKGSSSWDNRGQRYEIVAAPQGSLTVHQVRGEMRLAAGLELSYAPGGSPELSGGSGSFQIDHALMRDLSLHAAFALDGATERVNAITSASDVAAGPLTVTGTGDFSLEKQAGRASYTLGASLGRQHVGDTLLIGGATVSNASRSWSGFGLRARAGYALTPIIGTYVELEVDRAYYDAAASGGVFEDNWTTRGTLGLTGKWRNGLEVGLYGGYGLVQYDSGGLASGGGYVLGGSLSYPVARGGEITASLDTSFSPTAEVAGASTEIEYTASLAGSYLVNDWLTLRSALGGTWTTYPGISDTEIGLSAGAGLDWTIGPHTVLNADYTFGADFTPTQTGFSHTIAVGATISR